ncbi:MAG: hypothetical protein KGJ87_05220 [Planctomycetota bacterium]|nr:hypothetical protein [Planctomycetota bacterium]
MIKAFVKEITAVTAVLRFVPAHALTTLARLTKLIPYRSNQPPAQSGGCIT